MLVATIFYGAYFRFFQFLSTTSFQDLMKNHSNGNKGVWVRRVKYSRKTDNSLSSGIEIDINIFSKRLEEDP